MNRLVLRDLFIVSGDFWKKTEDASKSKAVACGCKVFLRFKTHAFQHVYSYV